MTVPAAPLPRIRHLFRAVTAPLFTGQQWAGSSTYAVRVYRQGSLALAAGIDAIRKAAEASTIVVWVPDYFCNEALDPIRQLPVVLRFYPIREDLTPDWPTVEQWAAAELGPQVFVLVHYFGFPNATKEARDFCNRHGLHNWHRTATQARNPTYTIYTAISIIQSRGCPNIQKFLRRT